MNPVLSMLHTQNSQELKMLNSKQSFLEFVQSMQGRDPKAMVDELRASGRMSEAQYQSLLKRAKDFAGFLK